MQTNITKKPSIFTLIVLISIASVAAVLYTPGLPEIQRQFKISSNTAQWTMSLFMLGYAFGQLIYAPITNRIRRKPTLYIGIFISIIGSIIGAISGSLDSFSTLLIGRFLQALGTSCGLTMTLTIINDVYAHEDSRRVIAFTTSAFAILPGVAVYIGGILVTFLGWESTFYFLVIYSLFTLLLCIFLPETSLDIDVNALRIKNILQRYKTVIVSMRVWCYSLMWGLCTAIVYIFAATAPIIAINQIKLSPSLYGAFNLIASAGLLTGTLSAGMIAKYYKARTAILLGLFLTGIACLVLLIFSQLERLNQWELFLPMFFVYIGMPFIISNSSALAAKNIEDKPTLSSLLSFINMSTAVVALFIIGGITGNPELIMPEVFSVIVLLLICLFFITRKWE